MTAERKSVRHLRTMARLTDSRRTRTPAGALLEMSTLANERERLRLERERMEARIQEIDARLAEIADKETKLKGYIKDWEAGPVVKSLPVGGHGRPVVTRQLEY